MKKKVLILIMLVIGICFNVDAIELEYRTYPELKDKNIYTIWLDDSKTIMGIGNEYACADDQDNLCNAYSINLKGEMTLINQYYGFGVGDGKANVFLQDNKVYACENPYYSLETGLQANECKTIEGVTADALYETILPIEEGAFHAFLLEKDGKFALANNKGILIDYSDDKVALIQKNYQYVGLYDTTKSEYIFPTFSGDYEIVSSQMFKDLGIEDIQDYLSNGFNFIDIAHANNDGSNIYNIFAPKYNKSVFFTKTALLSEKLFLENNEQYEVYDFNNEIVIETHKYLDNKAVYDLYKLNGEKYINGNYDNIWHSDRYIVLHESSKDELIVIDAEGEQLRQKLNLNENSYITNLKINEETIAFLLEEFINNAPTYYPAVVAPKTFFGEYTFLDKTADQIFNKSNKEDLIIRVDGRFEDFIEIFIDEQKVDKENYTVESGSTIIKFSNKFMKSLDLGEHSIKIQFADGIASTKVTVTENNEPAVDTFDGIKTIAITCGVSAIGALVLLKKNKEQFN